MEMGFPMGMGIPWESHNQVNGNVNYLHSHAFPWEYITCTYQYEGFLKDAEMIDY